MCACARGAQQLPLATECRCNGGRAGWMDGWRAVGGRWEGAQHIACTYRDARGATHGHLVVRNLLAHPVGRHCRLRTEVAHRRDRRRLGAGDDVWAADEARLCHIRNGGRMRRRTTTRRMFGLRMKLASAAGEWVRVECVGWVRAARRGGARAARSAHAPFRSGSMGWKRGIVRE